MELTQVGCEHIYLLTLKDAVLLHLIFEFLEFEVFSSDFSCNSSVLLSDYSLFLGFNFVKSCFFNSVVLGLNRSFVGVCCVVKSVTYDLL